MSNTLLMTAAGGFQASDRETGKDLPKKKREMEGEGDYKNNSHKIKLTSYAVWGVKTKDSFTFLASLWLFLRESVPILHARSPRRVFAGSDNRAGNQRWRRSASCAA